MAHVRVTAAAKVNLHLSITGIRGDGYHLLRMLMVPVTLFDEIVLEEIGCGVEYVCSDRRLPQGETNLAVRAALLVMERLSPTWKRGVRIRLVKRIPMGAGLGGGSSDAAAVLRGLNRLWDLGWTVDELMEFALQLGADVPFFCQDSPAICEGIGEAITPVDIEADLYMLLVWPGIHISTPWAYRQWDRLGVSPAFSDTTGCNHRDFLLTAKDKGASLPAFFEGLQSVLSVLHNDLELPVMQRYPVLAEIKERLFEAGAAGALMTGSGSTVFGLYYSKEERDRAAEVFRQFPWRTFCVRLLRRFC